MGELLQLQRLGFRFDTGDLGAVILKNVAPIPEIQTSDGRSQYPMEFLEDFPDFVPPTNHNQRHQRRKSDDHA